ncbi:histidyl-tRNA synthetase [Piedraia hortae CBS 480.64]|uniref:Histidine--tRNA ligase, mitochondrial n=1 Tax=Piedraia hortae CBS 480.64 TaxID=1314780 RepID=A0A6A7C8P0_9PEZI|nr:histidyl-tRNA synthetase [Piedraia hortae CBS 480.64]
MGKAKEQMALKVPKGTKDWAGRDMVLRNHIFATITRVFQRFGGVTLDTPTFELKEILTGKYGEDSKLIYDLADQGGELCALRYDLTVPFARWLAMNPAVSSIKRYQLAKVFRRDQPAMTKGRMREFYQCDFDIAGTFDPMLPDADIFKIITQVFDALGWNGRYTIKTNHRKILDGIFQVCGVPQDKLRTISSAVDKLDKSLWSEVKREMTEDKGLDAEIADRIGQYVTLKGQPLDLLQKLQADAQLSGNESAKAGLEDMSLLFRYLDIYSVLDKVSFDMSLARGLDYYTGVIYEVVTEGSAPQTSQGQAIQHRAKKESRKADDEDGSNDPNIGVGSIAAGGRYDELVKMFAPRSNMPCVGISFGIERIFSIIKSRDQESSTSRSNDVDVYVMALGGKDFDGGLKERMEVASRLRNAGINAEFMFKVKPKLLQQFKAAEQNNVPFALILGEDELKNGQCKIKELGLPEGHPEKDGVVVPLTDMEKEVKKRIDAANDLSNGVQKLTV